MDAQKNILKYTFLCNYISGQLFTVLVVLHVSYSISATVGEMPPGLLTLIFCQISTKNSKESRKKIIRTVVSNWLHHKELTSWNAGILPDQNKIKGISPEFTWYWVEDTLFWQQIPEQSCRYSEIYHLGL